MLLYDSDSARAEGRGTNQSKPNGAKLCFLYETSFLDLAFLSVFTALSGIALHSGVTNKAAGILAW